MCVIIHKPKGVALSVEDITNAFNRNRDGFGFMYYDPETQRIVASKKVFKTVDPILEIFAKQVDLEVVYHFRLKTHGKLSDSACHPFKVLDEKKHGQGMYMMHNGIISGLVDYKSEESDTQAFVRLLMQPLFREKPSMIMNRAQKWLIEGVIGMGNKLVFMYGKGQVIKFNEKQGEQYKGCWVSNIYSFNTNHARYNVNRGGQCETGKSNTGTQTATTTKDNTTNGRTGSDTTNLDTPRGSRSEGELLGEKIKIGDTVQVFHNTLVSYWSLATVHAIYQETIVVKGKNVKGVPDDLYFFLKDGEGSGRNLGYILHPPSWSDKNRIKTIGEYEAEKKEVTNTQNDTSKTATSNVVTLGDRVENLTKQLEGEDQKKVKDEPTLLTLANGDTFDPKGDRWGGAGLRDSSATYEEFSILDVYNMDAKGRWEFFTEFPIAAFSMFQDLVESKVLDDIENKDVAGKINNNE